MGTKRVESVYCDFTKMPADLGKNCDFWTTRQSWANGYSKNNWAVTDKWRRVRVLALSFPDSIDFLFSSSARRFIATRLGSFPALNCLCGCHLVEMQLVRVHLRLIWSLSTERYLQCRPFRHYHQNIDLNLNWYLIVFVQLYYKQGYKQRKPLRIS